MECVESVEPATSPDVCVIAIVDCVDESDMVVEIALPRVDVTSLGVCVLAIVVCLVG